MSDVIEFITLRGEYVSLFLVAGALAFSGRRLVVATKNRVTTPPASSNASAG